jgi:hypothetical protein
VIISDSDISSCLANCFTGHFTHNKRAVVPWRTLSLDMNYDYIDSNSLPAGMMLLDPSKLQMQAIGTIWNHWRTRQAANSPGLVFQKAEPGAMREATPQPQQSQLQKGNQEIDSLEGSSQEPHPDSPAAHSQSPASRIMFLRTLFDDSVYNKFVDHLESKAEVHFTLNTV